MKLHETEQFQEFFSAFDDVDGFIELVSDSYDYGYVELYPTLENNKHSRAALSVLSDKIDLLLMEMDKGQP